MTTPIFDPDARADELPQAAIEHTEGIRQQSLRRLIVLNALVELEHIEQGPVYESWRERAGEHTPDDFMTFLEDLRVVDYHALAERAPGYWGSDLPADLTVSDRTAEDYLNALRAMIEIDE